MQIAGGEEMVRSQAHPRMTISFILMFELYWQVCPMKKARSLFYMGCLHGHIYAVCGWTAPDTVTRTTERYIPTTDRWEYVAPLEIGLHEHAGVYLYIPGLQRIHRYQLFCP